MTVSQYADVSRDGSPTRNRTLVRRISREIEYLVRLPSEPDPDRTLVAVHGISRNASFIVRALAHEADRHDYTLLAPVFNHRYFPDYQRLGLRGARADLTLLAILEDAARQFGISRPVDLFGFSGGAQFAHRLVYAYHGLVSTLTLAAAGWYTDPRSRRRFPYGVEATPHLNALSFHPEALYDTPTLILVGSRDTRRDQNVRRDKRIDRVQGRNRLERARWFYRRLKAASERTETPSPRLIELKQTGHDFGDAIFKGDLITELFTFLNHNAEMRRSKVRKGNLT